MMNLSSLIRTARGSTPADLVYKNITMLMVTTGEWITGEYIVTTDDNRICCECYTRHDIFDD